MAYFSYLNGYEKKSKDFTYTQTAEYLHLCIPGHHYIKQFLSVKLLFLLFFFFVLNSIHTLSAVIIIGLDRLKCWANLTFCWLTVIWNHLNQDLFKTVKTPKILGERDTKHTNFKISSYLHLINFHSSIWFSHYRFVLISQLRAQTIGLPALC